MLRKIFGRREKEQVAPEITETPTGNVSFTVTCNQRDNFTNVVVNRFSFEGNSTFSDVNDEIERNAQVIANSYRARYFLEIVEIEIWSEKKLNANSTPTFSLTSHRKFNELNSPTFHLRSW